MLSKTAEYALRTVACLADKAGESESADLLSEQTRVPRRYLHKVLQDLVRAGLVESRSGPGGGYSLVLSAEEISILDVVNAVARWSESVNVRWVCHLTPAYVLCTKNLIRRMPQRSRRFRGSRSRRFSGPRAKAFRYVMFQRGDAMTTDYTARDDLLIATIPLQIAAPCGSDRGWEALWTVSLI